MSLVMDLAVFLGSIRETPQRGPFSTLLLALLKRYLTGRVYIPICPPNPHFYVSTP